MAPKAAPDSGCTDIRGERSCHRKGHREDDMTTYIIAEIEVTDAATYDRYKARTPGVIERYGGRFIVRGGRAETLEGDGRPGRLVVVEFPDMAAARRFYDSPEYQEIIGLRHQASRGRMILVEGHPPPA
jgi:uncharacterized protein (DUF1330 family)